VWSSHGRREDRKRKLEETDPNVEEEGGLIHGECRAKI
jgi:hypothetical protein